MIGISESYKTRSTGKEKERPTGLAAAAFPLPSRYYSFCPVLQICPEGLKFHESLTGCVCTSSLVILNSHSGHSA
jgi:hypothetical protein